MLGVTRVERGPNQQAKCKDVWSHMQSSTLLVGTETDRYLPKTIDAHLCVTMQQLIMGKFVTRYTQLPLQPRQSGFKAGGIVGPSLKSEGFLVLKVQKTEAHSIGLMEFLI